MVSPVASRGIGRHVMLLPAISVAIWSTKALSEGLERSEQALDVLMSDAGDGDLAVMPHTEPDRSDIAPIKRIREKYGRVWLGVPSNSLARMAFAKGVPRARETAKTWAKFAADNGCEAIMFNGERGRDRGKDWVIDSPNERATVAAFSREFQEGAREGAPGVAIGFTSHDMPQWFRLAWDVLFSEESLVDLHAPQHCPADPNTEAFEGFISAYNRVRSSQSRWLNEARNGRVSSHYIAGGSGYVPYGQIHGLTPAGAAYCLDVSDGACAWALPYESVGGRADSNGLLALRTVLRARKLMGTKGGSIRRVQEHFGLSVDHNGGPLTRSALGLDFGA